MARGPVASQINGVWMTALCEVNEDGGVNMPMIDKQVALFAEAGCDGVYSGGTASEIHLQTEDQYQEISAALANAARQHNLKFQIGTAHPLAQGTLDRVAFAASLSPLAIQVILPDWTPLDIGSVYQFMARVAEVAGETPLVLYNPPHAKTILKPEQLLDLCDAVPSLQGLKCGGGDADWYQSMQPVFDRISVFIPGHFHVSGCAQGAHGSYSNMACLNPRAAVAWAQMDHDAGTELEARITLFREDGILPILENTDIPSFTMDKAQALAGGWCTGMTARHLWPQTSVTQPQIARIVQAARKHIPEFIA